MANPMDAEGEDTTYAQGRLPSRTYASASFPIPWQGSTDYGQPARFVYKVFDPQEETVAQFDGEEWVISETSAGRYQVKLLVAREAGKVKELWIQRVPGNGQPGKATTRLNLRGPEATRLVELLRNLDCIPVEGEQTVRVDDFLVRELFANPDSLASLYRRTPHRLRQL